MRTSLAVVAMEARESTENNISEVIRTLTGLIEKANSGRNPADSANVAEEVLVDTEVDGARYLLLRMRSLGANRIQLSPREQEIVRMVAKGHPNKIIADVLNISAWTVCTHLRRIFAKLGVGSRAAMVAKLLEMGALADKHVPSVQR
jgi:DNA-binding CsgD family transcriptional regulator